MALKPLDDWLSDYRGGVATSADVPEPLTPSDPLTPPDPIIKSSKPIDEWLSDFRAGVTRPIGAPPSTINPPITDQPTSKIGGIVKELPGTLKDIALDLYGVHAKVAAGLAKGATLGAVDVEAGTVGMPFSADKKQIAVPLPMALKIMGVSPEIADNPDIGTGMGMAKAVSMGAEAVGVPKKIAEHPIAQGLVSTVSGPEGLGSLAAWGGISKVVGRIGAVAAATPEAVYAKAVLGNLTADLPQALSQFIGPSLKVAGRISQEAVTGALYGLAKVRGPDEDPMVNALTGAAWGAGGATGLEVLGTIGKSYKVAQLVKLKDDMAAILYESGTLSKEAAEHQAARVLTNTIYKKGGIGEISVGDIKDAQQTARETFEKIQKRKTAPPTPEAPIDTTGTPVTETPPPVAAEPAPAPVPPQPVPEAAPVAQNIPEPLPAQETQPITPAPTVPIVPPAAAPQTPPPLPAAEIPQAPPPQKGVSEVPAQTNEQIMKAVEEYRKTGVMPPAPQVEGGITSEVGKTEPNLTPTPIEQAPLVPQGTLPESVKPQSSVFPDPLFPSDSSIARDPSYIKLSNDALSVVNRYAKERGITEPMANYGVELFRELHDALGSIRMAPQEKRAEIAKQVLAKYPTIEQDFATLKDKLWSDKTDIYFEKMLKNRPQASGGAFPGLPEGMEKTHPLPSRPPGDRWTPDIGATPGEPIQYLDVKGDDLNTARAVIISNETEQGDEYFTVHGDDKKQVGGNFATEKEAAAYAEERFPDPNQEMLPINTPSQPLSPTQKGVTLKGEPTHEDIKATPSDAKAPLETPQTTAGGTRAGAGGPGSSPPLAGAPPEDVSGTPKGGSAEQGIEKRREEDAGRRVESAADVGGVGGEPPAGVLPSEGKGAADVGTPSERRGPATPRPEPSGRQATNFRITEADNVGGGNASEKYDKNIAAIKTLKEIEASGLPATPEQQKILVQYSGWGGLPQVFDRYNEKFDDKFEELKGLLSEEEYEAARASTPNAHYTSPQIIQAIYKALEHLGFDKGRILEPAAGVGHFIGLAPADMAAASKFSAVELDSLSARIAKQLYPKSDVRQSGYEQTNFPDNFFDVAASNVPFGNYPVHDPFYAAKGLTSSIHNYFFAKSIDKVRPGGIVAFVTSHFTMDGANEKLRKYLISKADLLGAIRLPNTAFKSNALTEVTTDIIFLKKREAGTEPKDSTWLTSSDLELKTKEGYDSSARINDYFLKHPEMVLGKHSLEGGMYRDNEYALAPNPGQDLEKAIENAIRKLPEAVYQKPDLVERQAKDMSEAMLPKAPDHIKEGGLFIEDNKVFKKTGEASEPYPGVSTHHVKAILDLRDTVRQTLRDQQKGATPAQVKKDIRNLNTAYDKFVKEYGHIDEKKNNVFSEDPDYPILLGLERKDRSTGKYKRADIFEKQVLFPEKVIESAETAKDAMAVSLNEQARIDWKRMSDLTGKNEKELQQELKGLVFHNPSNQIWETADEYLSGNVRDKLVQAESAAKNDPAFKENVEALKAVQPEDLKPSQIEARLGSTWIPASVIEAFAREITGVHRAGDVRFVPQTGSWTITSPKYSYDLEQSVGNTKTYGTERMSAMDILEDSLNNRFPSVYDKDAEGKSHINQKETELARDKQNKLKDKFKAWVMAEAERATTLSKIYNEQFNNMRLRTYDGAHLTLPGSNRLITLSAAQKNGIWRALQGRNVLLAHAVGAGKTFEMAAIAMETKRIGLAKKTVIVVKNNTLDQFAQQFLQLYPGANLLIAGKEDLNKLNRKTFTSRIATGDWDAIIIPHSSFERIPMSNATIEKFLQMQLDELQNAIEQVREEEGQLGRRAGSRAVKELEKAKKRLEAKIKSRLREEAKDDALPFEELGIDQLIVDEAQAYKNLFVPTKMTRVRGINSASDSYRAFDMFMKTEHINDLNGGRGVVFATGTPITNTVAEMYVMQRFLQNRTLKEQGIHNFDSWASNFGDTVSGFELDASGEGFRAVTRFAKFINVPELLTLFYQVADIQTAKMLKLPVPKLVGGKPGFNVAPRSPELADYIKTLVERAKKVRDRSVDPSTDNMLKISTDGRKAALDMRLVDPSAPAFPDSKISRLADKVHDIWKANAATKSTQLIFSDLGTPKEGEGFNAYAEIKKQLVAKGIPADQIAFIHDAKTDGQRMVLFDKVNAGDVRVLIGSTEKMGIGTNVQERLVAEHNLDVPYRPDWLEQREGRILRQGNKVHKEVEIERYSTEGSFDAFMWQTVVRKATFISQVLSGELTARTMEDLDDVTLNYKEIMAATTGNPLIKEKIETDAALSKLESLQKSYFDSKMDSQKQIAELPGQIEGTKAKSKSYSEDLKTLEKSKTDEFSMEIGGKKFTEREAAGNKIIELAKAGSARGLHNEEKIGSYRGHDLHLRTTGTVGADQVYVQLDNRFTGNISDNGEGTIRSLDYAMSEETVKRQIESLERERKTLEKRLADLKGQIDAPFEHAKKLEELTRKQKELEEKLDMNKGESTVGVVEKGEPIIEGGDEEDLTPAEEGGGGGGGSHASKGMFSEEFSKAAAKNPIYEGEGGTELGGIEHIKPMEMPELVELANELLSGKWPEISKRMGKNTLGLFTPVLMRLRLRPEIFKDPKLAAQVLAHELGHLIDYLPDHVMARGNILGRLKVLTRFLKNTFGEAEVTNKELRKELIALSEWWRPYDKATTSKSFQTYRNSSPELYADAISVLFNAPKELETRAPTFFKELFENLDKKPPVRDQFFKLLEALNRPEREILGHREAKLSEDFAEARKIWQEKMGEMAQGRKDLGTYIRQLIDYNFQALINKQAEAESRGIKLDDSKNPQFLADEASDIDAENRTMLKDIQKNVLDVADKVVTRDELGMIMFFERILGDREGFANPGGHNPETAKKGLANIKERLGEEKWATVQKAIRAYHDAVYETMERLKDAGVISEELFNDTIVPNRYSYIPYRTIDHVQDMVSPGLKAQIGTLKGIENPYVTGVLKMIAANRLVVLQNLKIATKDMLKEMGSEEISKAKPIVGPHGDRLGWKRERDRGHLMIWEDGKQVAYNVDPLIASSFDQFRNKEIKKIATALRLVSGNGLFRGLWITYNLGYGLYTNLIRDFGRNFKMGGVAKPGGIDLPGQPFGTALALLRGYAKAIPSAIRRAKGMDDALITEMEDLRALPPNFVDVALAPTDDQVVHQMKQMGIVPSDAPASTIRQKLMKPIISIMRAIQTVVSVGETTGKAGPYLARKAVGQTGKRLGFDIRNYAGTPNWRKGGVTSPVMNEVAMFSTIAKEDFKTNWEHATDPKTRSGYWWRTLYLNIVPKLAMLAAAYSGLDYADKKAKKMSMLGELYARVPENDKQNYIIIPLGAYPGGDYGWKTIYWRIPHDDFGRSLAAAFWTISKNALTGKSSKDAQELASVLDGYLPSLNPGVKLAKTWWTYARGGNPTDEFHGHPILTDTEQNARSADLFETRGLKKMLKWTLNQTGQIKIATYDDSTKSTTEAVLERTPWINSFIKISDYGLKEKERAAMEPVMAKDAAAQLDAKEVKQDAIAKLRKGDLSVAQDLGIALGDRKISPAQFKTIIQRAGMTEFQNRVMNMPLDQAVAVYNSMGEEEQKAIAPIIGKRMAGAIDRGNMDQVIKALK